MSVIIKPRQHQLDLSVFHREKRSIGTLVWHGMGLGKTLSSLWEAEHHLNTLQSQGVQAPKLLIICPKSAVITWREEIRDNVPSLNPRTQLYPISSIHHALNTIKYLDIRYIIIDESHSLKAYDTNRVQVMSELLKVLGSVGNRFKDGRIMALTGTPMPNGAHEIYTTWAMCTAPNLVEAGERMVDKERYKQWAASFAQKKTEKYKKWDKVKGAKVDKWGNKPQGAANVDKLCMLLQQFTHYRRVTDCLDIPPAKEIPINLNLPDDKLLKDADIEEPEAYMALVERLSKAKTPYMIGWIEEFIKNNPDVQLNVFTMHRAPLDAIGSHFGKAARFITGAEKSSDRSQNINDYRKGKFQIFGMTYKCGSESLNLQRSFVSLYHGYPWTDSTLRQAMARTYRSGQLRESYHYFLTSGANDTRVLGLVRSKQEATTAVEDELMRLEKQRIDAAVGRSLII